MAKQDVDALEAAYRQAAEIAATEMSGCRVWAEPVHVLGAPGCEVVARQMARRGTTDRARVTCPGCIEAMSSPTMWPAPRDA